VPAAVVPWREQAPALRSLFGLIVGWRDI
jgi:hypothetical protein